LTENSLITINQKLKSLKVMRKPGKVCQLLVRGI
jgi:hypothetical protein